MKAGHKFLLGAALIVGSVGFLIAEGVKETGVYFLTPTELAAKTASDPTFVENVGFKVGAKVVPGSVHRDAASRTIDFRVSDGVKTYPVTYHGLVPDTFTDANDIEVVVEGRLGTDGVFHATDVLAKCGSRYEAVHREGLSLHDPARTIRALGRLPDRASGAPSSRSPAAGGSGRSWRDGRRGRCTRSSPPCSSRRSRLWKGLITHDFNIEYVAAYTSRNLPHLFRRLGVLGRPEGLAALLGHGALDLRERWRRSLTSRRYARPAAVRRRGHHPRSSSSS